MSLDGYATEGVYELGEGKTVSADTLYSAETGYGFSDVTFNDAAKGWDGGVYYPRTATVSEGKASYVTAHDGYLAIKSQVWTCLLYTSPSPRD